MNDILCKEAKRIIQSTLNDIITIEDGGHYLWLYQRQSEEMVGIIHGGGDINKPFEMKVINLGDYKVLDFRFHNWNDFKDFLKNELRDKLLAIAL